MLEWLRVDRWFSDNVVTELEAKFAALEARLEALEKPPVVEQPAPTATTTTES